MVRLLLVCEHPTLLGGERSMLATLPAVERAGFEILVACPPAGPLADALEERGIAHIEWATAESYATAGKLSNVRSSLSAIVGAARPGLVHANSLSTTRIAGPVLREHEVPSVGHFREITKVSRQAAADINMHRRLIAVSKATRSYHVAQGIRAEACRVLYNGVDLAEFRPRPRGGYLHRELGIADPEARLVGTVGQIGLRKGTDCVLEVARRLALIEPSIHWLVVGERTSSKAEARELEARLHQVAQGPELAGRVHFLGTREDVPAILNELSVLLHAARQEPLGRVLLEAAASGVAIVATSAGGTPEIFPSETEAAVLVPVDDAAEMAKSVSTILADETRRRRLGRLARQRAESAFDVQQAADRLVQQYGELVRAALV